MLAAQASDSLTGSALPSAKAEQAVEFGELRFPEFAKSKFVAIFSKLCVFLKGFNKMGVSNLVLEKIGASTRALHANILRSIS